MNDGIVIAGGGLAGQRFCARLRSRGYDGRIRLVCEEDVPPYDRPPLSKAFLLGEAGDDELQLRPPHWYVGAGCRAAPGRASRTARSELANAAARVGATTSLRAAADRHRQRAAAPATGRGLRQRPLPADGRRRAHAARGAPPRRARRRDRCRIHRSGGRLQRDQERLPGHHPRGARGSARARDRRHARRVVCAASPIRGRRGGAGRDRDRVSRRRPGRAAGARRRAPDRLRRGRRRRRRRAGKRMARRQRAAGRWSAGRCRRTQLVPGRARGRRRGAGPSTD